MTTYALVLDDVLRRSKDQSINVQGLHLYHSLVTQGRLAILCGPDEERADWFLRSNGLTQHSTLLPERLESSPTPEGRRMKQIGALRAQGANIEFVIEPNPDIAAEIFRQGIPVMLYLHPKYTHPSFRPDYRSVAKPWDRLTAEVDYQIEMRAKHTYEDREPL